jgi:alkanesulfonate monooxygenase SsuD/methylene tetrahydromethanopterin reductase-like flavin-dependent oxidoreductase (luciferase family)
VDIGIGLPNTLPVDGTVVVDWARRAEERGFAALGTIDRIVYPTFDSLTVLAAAAGATSRIGLVTAILLAPVYQPMGLAKATGTLQAVSGGRLTLGVGVGGRPDDFAAMDRPLQRRGKLMDETLDLLERAWAGEHVAGGDFAVVPGPAAVGAVPVLIGGTSDAAVRRTVRYGAGWINGGGGPGMAAPMIAKIKAAWHEAGREGEPRISSLMYYGLSDEQQSRRSLTSYYGFLGEWANAIADSAARTPQAAKDVVEAFAEAGVTELMFVPTVASLDEVDRLADAVL